LREVGGILVTAGLQICALLGALAGRYEEAARLVGYVDAHYATGSRSREPTEEYIYGRLVNLLATKFSVAKNETFKAEGALWSENRALDVAFVHLISPEHSPVR
jgi:hypothetical protein